MRIARYRNDGDGERLGIIVAHGGGEAIVDVARAGAARGTGPVPASVMALIEGGEAAMDVTRELLQWAELRRDPAWLDDPDAITWLTPVPPKSLISAGRNFGRHKLESTKGNPATGSRLHSDFPTGFVKLGRTLVPHKSKVKRPKDVLHLDYEVEIALVIGSRIDADSDLDPARAIFGYTIFNDLSAREWQIKEMHNNLLMLGKNFPGFGPLGPCILTADEVPDPRAMVLWLRVNGEMRQHSDCRDLIFDFEDMVAFWSRIGLVPGDIITTGTPEGVALHHKPDPMDWYLKPGDRVEAGVDGIGVLETTIV
ncbi:MAG: fumarylacetoacetate hydrolase family protein [Burkholderiales bacterium]|nr:fumarylacetoacetate hydrolase family protein [Burkholderiales bacterium]